MRVPPLNNKEYLSSEVGYYNNDAPCRVALVYPSPYRAGMSSLGFQAIYRLWNEHPNLAADRAFLPDDVELFKAGRKKLHTFERNQPLDDYRFIAFSISYELELSGMIQCLELANIPPLVKDRSSHHPLIIAGGPLTFSNPETLAPFCDVVAVGEGEELALVLADVFCSGDNSKKDILIELSKHDGFYIPSIHDGKIPGISKSSLSHLPARSQIISPHTELRSMFLTEAVRGCSRGCTYCVMRRSTNGGMRVIPIDRIIDGIPDHATKVGLVGAAVTDHPKIAEIVRAVVDDKKCSVGISSLRADRLTNELVSLLAKGGYKTLTVAFDAASRSLRETIERKTNEEHVLNAAQLAKTHQLKTLKLYMMVGLPGETDDDLEELIDFLPKVKKIHPTIALGVAPFVAKRHTPLDGAPFAGIKTVDRRLALLRKKLQGIAVVRPTSARWAWVEYMLAQGNSNAGLAVYDAHKNGGTFADYKRAFKRLSVEPTGAKSTILSGNEKIKRHKSQLLRLKMKTQSA